MVFCAGLIDMLLFALKLQQVVLWGNKPCIFTDFGFAFIAMHLTVAIFEACLTLLQAASDVYAPMSGEVVEVNNSLVDDPALVSDFKSTFS